MGPPPFLVLLAGYDPTIKLDGRNKYVKKAIKDLMDRQQKRKDRKAKKKRWISIHTSNPRMDNQVKIAVLEQKLEDLTSIVLRIDTANPKLSEVNTTVSRMLAVHEGSESQNKKKLTLYCLQRLTNSVIKWTGIMTSYCKEYVD